MIDLTDSATIKKLLLKTGQTPQRSAGQNFLISREVVEATLIAARSGPQRITELGAGLGTLTQALIAAGFTVRAIEQDRALAKILPTSIPPRQRNRIELFVADLRHLDWTWAENYQLIGNIPYNLSGLILRRLTQLTPPPSQVILLLQKEVAQRLAASPPNMHLISLAVQLWGEVQPLLHVPRTCFWPQPQVDSQLVLLLPHANPPRLEQREAILQTAKQFFQHRRKQMGQIMTQLNLPPTIRPQELTITQWAALHDILG